MKNLTGAVISMLVVGLVALSPVQAASSWPSQGSKKVDSVDLKNGNIVIGDVLFKTTSATRVYTPTGSSGTLQQLRKGTKVRVNLVGEMGQGVSVISEIFIVPGN